MTDDSPTTIDLLPHLRQRTSSIHAELESEFDLSQLTRDPAVYHRWLGQQEAWLSELLRAISMVQGPAYRQWIEIVDLWHRLVSEDLDAMAQPADNREAMPSTLSRNASSPPPSLPTQPIADLAWTEAGAVGILYVVLGSAMGGRMILSRLRGESGPAWPCTFLNEVASERTRVRWRSLIEERMGRVDRGAATEAADAACWAFERFPVAATQRPTG